MAPNTTRVPETTPPWLYESVPSRSLTYCSVCNVLVSFGPWFVDGKYYCHDCNEARLRGDLQQRKITDRVVIAQKRAEDLADRRGCLCEPCELDITQLISAKSLYFDSEHHKGTACKWHWEYRGKVKGRYRGVFCEFVAGIEPYSGALDVTVCADSPKSVYVTWDNEKSTRVGAIDLSIASHRFSVFKKVIKWQ